MLYKFPDHAATSRTPAFSKETGDLFSKYTSRPGSHGTLSEEVSREPASDSTLRFNFYVGLTSFLLTRLSFRSPLIEHVLINHATLIRVAVNSSDEHYGYWYGYSLRDVTPHKKIIDKVSRVNVRAMYLRHS